jgi:NADPH-dependent curcumin reductase
VIVPLLNLFARVPACGLIAQYNATEFPPRRGWAELLMATVLAKRLTFGGFIVTDFTSQSEDFFAR